jgi:hypothetical protein
MKKTTKIFLTIAGGALAAAATFSACKKSSSTPLPAIGGYNTSNDIESSSLLAHWTFESTLNELKSSTAPTSSSGITYATGVNGTGKAAQFSNGYAVFPSISALSTATTFSNGFTVSVWVKPVNNGTIQSCLFALSSAADSQLDWNDNPINMYVETGAHMAGSDTFQLHGAFASYNTTAGWLRGDNVNAYGRVDTDFHLVIDTGWINYVLLYNGSTSRIQIYANSALVSDTAFEYRTYSAGGIGAITAIPPTQVVLGSFLNSGVGFPGSAVQTWQGLLTGTMDNLRVYNTPLSTSEISALYQLESVGR